MMKENRSKIVLNEPMGASACRLRFEVDWDSYVPGQFVMVEVPGGEVFLRRPFGIAGLEGGLAEICYKIVGRGTRALTSAKPGTPIDILGPCGNGFSLSDNGATSVLVAGGYGIGPLMGLAAKAGGDGVIYYGAKTASDFLYLNELEGLGVKLVLATEDGSAGEKGLVTDVLTRDIGSIEKPAIFCCGPHGLLEAVAKLGISKKIPTQVSTEEYMACGIGVCGGCATRASDGRYVGVCKDGPVFDVRDLKWD